MVIDTSAIVAILFDEPERDHFTGLIDEAGLRLASVVGRVEAVCVIEGRKHEAGRERLDRFFRLTGAEIVGVTPELPEVAVEAFRRFGRGRHPARLKSATALPMRWRKRPASRSCSRAPISAARMSSPSPNRPRRAGWRADAGPASGVRATPRDGSGRGAPAGRRSRR
jgi:ribonuclease VapC